MIPYQIEMENITNAGVMDACDKVGLPYTKVKTELLSWGMVCVLGTKIDADIIYVNCWEAFDFERYGDCMREVVCNEVLEQVAEINRNRLILSLAGVK